MKRWGDKMCKKVQVVKLTKEAVMPKKSHAGDAGYDVFTSEPTVLKPMERKLVGTGIKMAVPKNIEAQVRPKSGLAINNGLAVLNSPGTIDPNYRGEIKVILINLGNKEIRLDKGQKIAQLIFSRFETPELEETEKLDETERNEGGFGSTGLVE